MSRKKSERIGYADTKMIPQLTRLWMTAFGDAQEYVDFYFENRHENKNILVYLIGEKPVSMISMLPAVLHANGKKQPIRYIYAVATEPAHRNKGYARALIEEGIRLLEEPFVLEPATKKLTRYYKKIGFHAAFYVSEEKILLPFMQIAEIKQKQQYRLLTVTPEEYKHIRDKKLGAEGYVEWSQEAISYVLRENDFCGGYAYKVFHDKQEDILLYRFKEEVMCVIETTLKDADILGVIQKLQITSDTILVRRPVTTGKSKSALGMILGEEIKTGYLNLTLE